MAENSASGSTTGFILDKSLFLKCYRFGNNIWHSLFQTDMTHLSSSQTEEYTLSYCMPSGKMLIEYKMAFLIYACVSSYGLH